jgi:hypothetical protein
MCFLFYMEITVLKWMLCLVQLSAILVQLLKIWRNCNLIWCNYAELVTILYGFSETMIVFVQLNQKSCREKILY